MPTRTINFALTLTLCTSVFLLHVSAQAPHPKFFNERFIMKAMDNIHGAQATYQTTTGNGSFGSLAALYKASLIDSSIASGLKFGYSFELQFSPSMPGTPSAYSVTATPVSYRKTGQRSFFIDTSGVLRGGDKNGGAAGTSDPYIDSCALWGLGDNEKCTILDMRNLHSFEEVYASSFGNGSYGTFEQLFQAGLIRSDLVDYAARGFYYTIVYYNSVPGQVPARFAIRATPQSYGTTGIRSFYIDQTGILRGADKQGQRADETDPPIN